MTRRDVWWWGSSSGDLFSCSTKKNLDPAVVKVDERKKLFLTTKKFIAIG